MRKDPESSLPRWMTAAVLLHLAISMTHGVAHVGAHVPMSAAANLFVFLIVLAGPVVGLTVSWRAPQIGSGLVALTMTGSLVFGIANHFVLGSADHVSNVAPAWRTMFGATAVLLALVELLGLGLALSLVRGRTLASTSSSRGNPGRSVSRWSAR